jgi:hypothetical protein
MLVKLIWRDCDLLNGDWANRKVDSFWVEVDEADLEDVLKYAQDRRGLNMDFSINKTAEGKFFMLVAKDLSSIMIMPEYYPYSGQWNYGSPFEEIPKTTIKDLQELENLKF